MAHAHTHHHAAEAEESLILPGLVVLGMAAGLAAHFAGRHDLDLWGYGLVYLAGGVPSALEALRSLLRAHILDIDLLMVLAALAAAVVGAPLEGAILLTLFTLAGALEHRAMGRARRALEALMALRPETALLRDGACVREVPADSLQPGDVVVLRPGARVPVDGVIVAGEGALDESTLTGEAEPRHKTPGAALYEATVNLDGVLDMAVTRALSDSTVARMIHLVTEAQAARAPSERFSAWFGQRYTVAVLAGALAAWAVMLGWGLPPDLALYRAATLLVAASPCAIVISVPAAILSALSAAARGGVLFKGGAALETLAEVRAFAFDKTGTLTTGRAEVARIVAPGMAEDAFLGLVSGLEAQSEHPIASAIRREVAERGLKVEERPDVRSLPSLGIASGQGEAMLWAGNLRLVKQMRADPQVDWLAGLQADDRTLIHVGQGARLIGALSVADQPRATSRDALTALRATGATLAMLTGDREPVAQRIAAELGLRPEETLADLLPEDKVALVAELAAKGRVAFVGDGVNDAAALARADIGVAMGAAGSEVALQAADVALLSEEMTQLPAAYRLARRTRAIIRQNLAFSLGAMAVLVLGALLWELPLPLAVIGHEGGTVLVVLNGLRLLGDPIRRGGGATE
ncbi:heavy metal translocating P-type ATPase [Tabrizicola oligotrophica]|uniref:Cadmium-translocating P-type ATPase n=1 Tax=Tabrizicola oligotrophica TaxID=2710650 RepID=A0A6M0QS01_9RHOB|nr:cation-translocating P-type ATPase [Tabrizicola oligotrophica]NEY89212.1 cadmium-translocating P-type ATPase [Tabrizicola oligotrophica]